LETALVADRPRTDPLLESLLAQCAQEPIHTPGHIQSFGLLLLFDADWRLEASAVGNPLLLPEGATVAPGMALDELYRHEAQAIHKAAEALRVGTFHPLVFPSKGNRLALEGRVHATPGGWILELWPLLPQDNERPRGFLGGWLGQLEQSGDLVALADRLTVELRRELGYDRVLVYQLDAEANGEVIAEDCRTDWPSFRGLWFPASDIPPQARELYLRNRVRLLVDRDAPVVPLLPPYAPRSATPWDLSLCLLRGMSPVHLLYLRNMGVAASLVASIVVQGRLWGLIACHHGEPYLPPQGALEHISGQAALMGLAIERSEERQRSSGVQQAQHWLTQALSTSQEEADWTHLLVSPQVGMLEVIPADGIALVRGRNVYRQWQTPQEAECLALRDWLETQNESVVCTDRLGEIAPGFAALAPVAAGLMALRLPRLAGSWLMWFRGEIRQQVRWAGDPRKRVQASDSGLRLQPRASFDAWWDEVAGRSRAWSTTEQAIVRESIRLNLLNVLVGWQEHHVRRLSAFQEVLLEQVGDAIYLLDAQGIVQYVNPAAEQLFGWTLREAVGRHLPELCEGTGRVEIEAILQQVQQGHAYRGERLSSRCRRGPLWIDTRMQPIGGTSDQPFGIIEISRDASQRKQAEFELRERERTLRSLIERIGAGVVVFRPDGSVRMANQRACPLLRLTHEAVLELNVQSRFLRFWDSQQQPLPPSRCPLRQALSDGKARGDFEVGFCPWGNTELVWLSCNIEPEYDDQGRLLHLIWTFSNSTERRRALQALRTREELYRLLAENATDLITALDGAGNLVYVSPMCRHLLGLTPEQMLDMPWQTFLHPDDHTAWTRFFAELGTQSPQKLEYRILQASGATRWVETTANPQATPPQTRIICVTRDIEERRHLQEHQRRLEKYEALGSLAGQVAHDFNNLLTVILGASSEAIHTNDPGRSLQDIRTAAEQGRQLTRKLLTFSRTQPVRRESLALEATIRGMLPLLERFVGVNMQIALELNAPLAAVWADQGQLEQALLNLVGNARDAMAHRGTLRILTRSIHLERSHAWLPGAHKPGVYTQLSIVDQGCGMEEATQKRIFEPFFTTKPAGQGTGLGMSIVQHIVNAAQGFVRVESRVGQGTAVHLFFPFQAIQVELTPTQPTPRPTRVVSPRPTSRLSGGKGQRLLLVEDNAELRHSTSRLLTQAGYTVQAVDCPAVALQHLEAGETYDLLLTDVALPGMSGPELAQQFAERLPGRPVLFMSGFAPEASLEQGLPIEIDNFLQKPFSPPELLEAIRTRLQGNP
jgi:PAS domain S-box-containing protein